MGIWEFISSTAVKNACKASYSYCSAAASKINNAVRDNGIQRLSSCMRDEETRSLISLFALKLAKNAALKMIPGGQVLAEIISDTINDVRSENHRKQEMKARKEVQVKGKSGIFDHE